MTRAELKRLRGINRAFRKTREGQGYHRTNISSSSPPSYYVPPQVCPALIPLNDREREAVRAVRAHPNELLPGGAFAGWRLRLGHLQSKRDRAAAVREFAAVMVDYDWALAAIPKPTSPAAPDNSPTVSPTVSGAASIPSPANYAPLRAPGLSLQSSAA